MGANACRSDAGNINEDTIKHLDPRTKKIVKIIRKYKIDLDPHVAEGGKIDLSSVQDKISIRNIDKLGLGAISNLNKLFIEAEFKEVKTLFMTGGDISLDKLKPGLPSILKKVNKQVLLSNFKINKSMLKLLFENCSHVESLGLCFSQIDQVSKKWKLDSTINYKIKKLDLFGSCHRSWSDHLSEKKLDKFFKALSETSLRESLKVVHTKEDWFLAKHMQPILDKYGFTATVEGDNEKPTY